VLRGKAANGRPVKREVIPALDEELLVVIEHVQPAFEVAEEDRHGFNPFLVAQVLEALSLNLLRGNACEPFLLGAQIQFFQFAVGEFQVVLQIGAHASP